MTYHRWGDEDFDWEALNEAMNDIFNFCKKWAYMHIHMKEKYGSIRYEFTFSYLVKSYIPLHDILKPGYLYIRYTNNEKLNNFIFWLDRNMVGPLIRVMRIDALINKYRRWIFDKSIIKTVKKYPHIAEEILEDYPFEEKPKQLIGIKNIPWSKEE